MVPQDRFELSSRPSEGPILSSWKTGGFQVFDIHVDVAGKRSAVTGEPFPAKTFDQLLPSRGDLQPLVEMDAELPDDFLTIAIGPQHVRVPEWTPAAHVDVEGLPASNVDDRLFSHRVYLTRLSSESHGFRLVPPPGVAPGPTV